MQFTTLFVAASTVAMALASPLLPVPGSTTTTVNKCSGNHINSFCCNKITTKNTVAQGLIPIAVEISDILNNPTAGLVAVASGCNLVGSSCKNTIVCCDSADSINQAGLINIGKVDASCIVPGGVL